MDLLAVLDEVAGGRAYDARPAVLEVFAARGRLMWFPLAGRRAIMESMTERRTRPNDATVDAVLDAVPDQRRRADATAALALIRETTRAEPVVWGSSIIGFGRQPYTTADGKEREWFAVGLAPRKAALTLYGLTFYGSNDDLLERLGSHTTGKGCVYIKRLEEVDQNVLKELVARAWETNHQPG